MKRSYYTVYIKGYNVDGKEFNRVLKKEVSKIAHLHNDEELVIDINYLKKTFVINCSVEKAKEIYAKLKA